MVNPTLPSLPALQQAFGQQQADDPAVPHLQMDGQPQPKPPRFPELTAPQRAMAIQIADDVEGPDMALRDARMAMNIELQMAAQNGHAVPIAQKEKLEAVIATATTRYERALRIAGAGALQDRAEAGVAAGAAYHVTAEMRADLVAAQKAVKAIIQEDVSRDATNVTLKKRVAPETEESTLGEDLGAQAKKTALAATTTASNIRPQAASATGASTPPSSNRSGRALGGNVRPLRPDPRQPGIPVGVANDWES
jgi:hypothetical protein